MQCSDMRISKFTLSWFPGMFNVPILVDLHVVAAESASPHNTTTRKDDHNHDRDQNHNKGIPVLPYPVNSSNSVCMGVCMFVCALENQNM